PATNIWTTIGQSPGGGGTGGAAVWTGSRMIVYGGFFMYPFAGGHNEVGWFTSSGGGIYDPATNSWTSLPDGNIAADRRNHSILRDGSAMIIVGGESTQRYWSSGQMTTFWSPRNSVVRLDPDSGVWESLGEIPSYAAGTPVWTGTSILTSPWGTAATGGRFDPETGLWSPLSTLGAPSPRFNPAVAWDGEGMLVTGGDYNNTNLSDRGPYIPGPP